MFSGELLWSYIFKFSLFPEQPRVIPGKNPLFSGQQSNLKRANTLVCNNGVIRQISLHFETLL